MARGGDSVRPWRVYHGCGGCDRDDFWTTRWRTLPRLSRDPPGDPHISRRPSGRAKGGVGTERSSERRAGGRSRCDGCTDGWYWPYRFCDDGAAIGSVGPSDGDTRRGVDYLVCSRVDALGVTQIKPSAADSR